MQKVINGTRIGISIDYITQSKSAQWLRRKCLWFWEQSPKIVPYGYAFLYMYTGYDKLLNVEGFIKGNRKIPHIGQYAELIGWGIPTLEILLAILLIVPLAKVKRLALWISVMLMGVFVLYLASMLLFAEKRLCHCGGVIASMGWTTHLIFNLCWFGAGIYALRKIKSKKQIN